MNNPYVSLDIENEVAHIQFFHPKQNSLSSSLLLDLKNIIINVSQNEHVKVVVLESAGDRAFCAGASFDEMMTIDNEDSGKAFFSGFADVINAIRTCPKLFIGRIQGKAIGGGVGLIASLDYCFATKYAEIKLSELSIGIGPFVIGPAVERKIGTSAMSQLTIKSDTFFSAKWSEQKGLYSEVFDSSQELDQAVKKMTELICTYNPDAVKEMKKLFWEGTEDWNTLLKERAQITGRLVLSSFTKDRLRYFQKNK